jgi:hypothetical protein
MESLALDGNTQILIHCVVNGHIARYGSKNNIVNGVE